jgi:DNA-binding MarR family transcriptional regulator
MRCAWHDLGHALRLAHQHPIAPRLGPDLRQFPVGTGLAQPSHRRIGRPDRTVHGAPRISWDGTILQIRMSKELDVQPRGAGVTLLPSTLWTGRPMITDHPDGSTAIVYPALTPLPLTDEAGPDPLAGLLGQTRAAVLRLAFRERTTTELARELGTSAATVSGHTKTLRAAGLIVTARAGKAVLHSVTPLGGRLLESATGDLHPPRSPALKERAPLTALTLAHMRRGAEVPGDPDSPVVVRAVRRAASRPVRPGRPPAPGRTPRVCARCWTRERPRSSG